MKTTFTSIFAGAALLFAAEAFANETTKTTTGTAVAPTTEQGASNAAAGSSNKEAQTGSKVATSSHGATATTQTATITPAKSARPDCTGDNCQDAKTNASQDAHGKTATTGGK